jgi:adenosine deaminase
MSLETYLRAAPKAELHVHLEGAMQPETLLELARRNAVSLPGESVEALRAWFTFSNFQHFLEVYMRITSCLRQAEDYEFVAYTFGAEMARQHIRYAEATFTAGTQYAQGVPFDVYFTGLSRGRERARADFGVEINWVFDIVRSIDDRELCARLADYTVGAAIEGKDNGVVALGLGGMEAGYPPEPFERYFDRARAAGLHSVPHSGETAGPVSIWGSLRVLHAERIGHGVRAIEDPALVAHLAAAHIPLEVNPTSNIRLGVYPDYAAHPLRRLYEAGVIVTVNSDDPPLFNTTLNDEVLLLNSAFGLDVAAIDDILLNGIRHSFLPPARKQALEAAFREELSALKKAHLG